MSILEFTCPKCGNSNYEIGQFLVPGGFWTKTFNFNYKYFTTITCSKCYFTEVYRMNKKKFELENPYLRR
jgi:predicted nucleic-acid-binding Zn-ribbon protein